MKRLIAESWHSDEIRKTRPTPLPLTDTSLKIDTWMGGDRDGNPNVTASWRDAMQQMSERSLQAYRATVRSDPNFVGLFRALTPERELGILAWVRVLRAVRLLMMCLVCALFPGCLPGRRFV